MNRRSFIQFLALFTCACETPVLLADQNRSSGLAAANDTRPIVIVGAGMAGLAAAQALHRAGKSVMVLEGRQRIGGRTFTTEVGAATVDLGGAWIHGVRGNPVAQFARANDITYTRHRLDLDALYDNVGGGYLEAENLQQVEALISGFENAASGITSDLEDNVSYADAVTAYLDSLGITGADRRRAQFALEMLASNTSAPLNQLSFRSVFTRESEELDGGDHVIAGGYRKVIEKLAQGLDILTNTAVRKIVYDSDGVQIITPKDSIEAAQVVVTVPLSVLKAGTLQFSPPLPASKQSAIERLGFGFFEKVVMVFKERYWQAGLESTLAYLGGLGPNRQFPYFVDMTDHAGAPTLVCIYSGQFAQQAQQARSEAELIRQTLTILRTLMGSAFVEPIATRATTWTSDPFSRGAYSYLAVGSSSDDLRTLAEPVGMRVLFAGEATSVQYSQTVHGAFLSGLREAQRLVPRASLA